MTTIIRALRNITPGDVAGIGLIWLLTLGVLSL
jgi:hypothetical protein